MDQKVGPYATPYQYTGQELDAKTGLYNYGARYYDPRISQFMSVDPLADAPANLGTSPYTYVWNNPINNIDPDGRHGEGVTDEYERTWNNQSNSWDYKRISGLGGNDFDVVHTTTGTFAGGDLKTTTDIIPNTVGTNERLTNEMPGMWKPPMASGQLGTLDGMDDPVFNVLTLGMASRTKAGAEGLEVLGFAAFKYGDDAARLIKFGGDEAVEHFAKHGSSVMNALGKSSYNLRNYIDDANHVINSGTFIPNMNGYIKLIGGQGSGKFGFVGMNRATGNITTFHIKTGKELSKKAPSVIGY